MPGDTNWVLTYEEPTVPGIEKRPLVDQTAPKWFPLLSTPFAIRWDLLDERQAMKNHEQTLTRLAERGGLDPIEAMANVQTRGYQPKDFRDAFAALIAAYDEHKVDFDE